MGKLSVYDVIRYAPKYKTFVESGSYKGDTIMTLLNYFNNLYTIELNKELYDEVRKRFSHLDKVKVLNGDSKVIFLNLLPKLPDYTIFYLDAHWSGDRNVNWKDSLWKGYECDTSYVGDHPTAENQVPLGEELKSIVSDYSGNAIILIDDIEVIGTKDLKFVGEDWSHLSMELIEKIISPRAKSFNVTKNRNGSQIGIIELFSKGRDYWSHMRNYHKITIRDIDYIVGSEEFLELYLPDYEPMIIRRDIAHLDRLIYVLNRLSLSTMFIGYEYGGYIMRNLKYRSYLMTSSMIDPKLIDNVELVNEVKNVGVIYLSDVTKDIDPTSHLVVISKHTLVLNNRKEYHMELFNFYVTDSFVPTFERRVRVRDDTIIDNNLMQLLIMVKNGGSEFYDMLSYNAPLFDSYIIMDTGSTDNTIEIINKIIAEHPHGKMYRREWKGFRDSRNELLDIAGEEYFFNVMLDDTYYLRGDLRTFLNKVRGDDVAQSFSLYIKDSFNCYISTRVTKSHLGLRYVNRIHEMIETNINLKIPEHIAFLEDKSSNYMKDRTMNRKREDLKFQLLDYTETPYDTNIIYHLAETYLCLKEYENAFDTYNRCIELKKLANVEQIQDCYYKIATITKCNLSPDFLLSRKALTWEEYYLKAYETIPERPEALYVIGHHYFITQNYDLAYYWLEKAYQVNIRMTDRPNMNGKHAIYDNNIYEILIPTCYIKSDYELGLACTGRMSDSNSMKSFWMSVFFLLVEYYKTTSIKKSNQGLICFIAPGGWEKWDGSTLVKKGLGGTETAVIRFAETMAKTENVVILCNCEHDKIFNNVSYINVYKAPEFFATNSVETCYINRYPEYIPLCSKANVKNIYLILHDTLRDYEQFLEPHSIKKVFLLSEWHRSYFLERIVLPTGVISYGIDMPILREKKKYSFMYPSFPNRGLVHLLDIFPYIRERYPDATLNVFCDLEHSWSNTNYPDMMREIKDKIIQDGVTNHGWVNEETLKRYWSTTDVWLYPCIFKETYCRVCLEAAANRALMISNDLAALSDNNKGIIINGDIDDNWKRKALGVVFDFFENEAKYSDVIERCYRWAILRSYDNVVKLLI